MSTLKLNISKDLRGKLIFRCLLNLSKIIILRSFYQVQEVGFNLHIKHSWGKYKILANLALFLVRIFIHIPTSASFILPQSDNCIILTQNSFAF